MGMQASGLYEGLIFDLPQTCPNCDQSTEIITWAEWQSREGLVPPHGSTFPNELVCPRWPSPSARIAQRDTQDDVANDEGDDAEYEGSDGGRWLCTIGDMTAHDDGLR
jgi:hypothetical protein